MNEKSISFRINLELIAMVMGFPLKGDKIIKEKHYLAIEIQIFRGNNVIYISMVRNMEGLYTNTFKQFCITPCINPQCYLKNKIHKA